jgi:hypothetical protein
MYGRNPADIPCLQLNQVTIEDIFTAKDDVVPLDWANIFKQRDIDVSSFRVELIDDPIDLGVFKMS